MRMYTRWILAAAGALAMFGCNNESTADAGVDAGQLIAVNFSIDDRANNTFTVTDGGYSDLRWKGSMLYDSATKRISLDSTWGGPFAPLYDDGPTTAGGHEPAGATAGDHIWGVTVYATIPAADAENYEYGAIDYSTGGWLWRGSNGKFSVQATDTAPITATGLTLLAFGKTDLKIVIDTTSLAVPTLADGGVQTLPDGGAFAWDTTSAHVKGGGWGWQDALMYDDGTHGDATGSDHKFTFLMSNSVGAGSITPHSGLLASGDQPQFVVELGTDKKEYRELGKPSSTGVSASLLYTDGGVDAAAITHGNTDSNCQVTVP